MAALLASIDAVIVPGRHESFSLVTAEAMACGVPVVVAHEGGAAELVACSGGGVSFRSGDSRSLVGEVRALLAQDSAEREEMGECGREHVLHHHTWGIVFRRIRRVYERLLRTA